MPSPLSPDQLDIYGKFRALADNFVVEFDTGDVCLEEHEYSGVDRIFDAVDAVYEEGKDDMGLDYKEIQVLAAIAVVSGAEFKIADPMPPGDRSYGG